MCVVCPEGREAAQGGTPIRLSYSAWHRAHMERGNVVAVSNPMFHKRADLAGPAALPPCGLYIITHRFRRLRVDTAFSALSKLHSSTLQFYLLLSVPAS